jgi:ribosomal-protein-alanine N-acetyltransferase
MRLEDLPAVMEIDRLSFPIPWSERTYQFEITENPSSHLLVTTTDPESAAPAIIGFSGYWLVVDEAHISTFAVHPQWRRQGIGGALMREVLRQAAFQGATIATLEVRVSNLVAQHLYANYGFVPVGNRRGYYRDNNEDALLMTTYSLKSRA